jgi:iron complex outermembrane recepter protein
MNYQGRNQYWVASNGLDWEAMTFGALAGSLIYGGAPTLMSTTSYDGEYRRDDVQSRSVFLEGTYDIIPDELKAIVGARYNDDRSSYLTTPVAVGGSLLANSLALVGTQSCPSPATIPNLPSQYIIAPCVGVQMTNRIPTLLTGKNVTSTDLWTGRATIQWSPKLSWTDQTQVYFTASRGELAGGLNKAQGTATLVVPQAYAPATVDALEFGTKNTLLDGTLQANLDVWYYNYENYQVGIIANRAALTYNIPAHLYGMEGEFVWQPDENLAFNMTLSLTRSQAGNAFAVDQRNPTAGLANTILVKDMTNGSLCVLVPITAAAVGHTPGESNPAFHVNNFYLPNGGNAAIDAPYGVPLVNYGVCPAGGAEGPSATTPLSAGRAALIAAGFDLAPATNGVTGTTIAAPTDVSGLLRDGTGVAVNLHGNKLPDVPNAQIGVGAQWTEHLNGGYTLVPRLDYYWQSSMESRVNGDGADYVSGWDTMNGQIQLNAPDNKWYARVFATNIFNKQNPTGVYLTDPTSALFTNVFSEDPRVVGVSVGANW